MSIQNKIRCLEFFVSKVTAKKNADFSGGSAPGGLAIKRQVSHSFELPKARKDSFRLTIIDRLTFGKATGPFLMEITISGVVTLKQKLTPGELASLLKEKENVEFLINRGLPHSCSTVSYLTERMGFSPIILAPRSFST